MKKAERPVTVADFFALVLWLVLMVLTIRGMSTFFVGGFGELGFFAIFGMALTCHIIIRCFETAVEGVVEAKRKWEASNSERE